MSKKREMSTAGKRKLLVHTNQIKTQIVNIFVPLFQGIVIFFIFFQLRFELSFFIVMIVIISHSLSYCAWAENC